MGQYHILVVEDHKPLLDALDQILTAQGYTVSTAMDGLQALEAMKKSQPDLIVADIMMPRMDGYTLYERVRERPAWVPIPFIFLTAKAEREDVLRGKSLGAEDYITKPFDPEELVVAVRTRLQRAHAIRTASRAEFEQLKQQIITILGHELRTPLTYVTGYTELAMEDMADMPPQALQEFLSGIKRGADRLTQLVENLLLLVYLDTGQAQLEFDTMAQTHHDLAVILEQTVDSYRYQAASKDVTLSSSYETDLPPVRMHGAYFVDALTRLIDNAIKFSTSGKKVTVSTQFTDGQVTVSVSDEGVGIPSAELYHIFERFRQIDREHMEQQGIGLGLAIARELIRLHGGDIKAESAPGAGSTFTIRLPVAEPSSAEL